MSHERLNRLIVPLAVLTAGALIAVWFPFSTLMNQSGQLDATARQISLLRQEQSSLAAQQRALSTTQAETLLARQEYQLVAPGQRLIQILNNDPSASNATGDPGAQPLVAPSAANGLLPGNPSLPVTAHKSSGFWTRLTRTLEFWR